MSTTRVPQYSSIDLGVCVLLTANHTLTKQTQRSAQNNDSAKHVIWCQGSSILLESELQNLGRRCGQLPSVWKH